MRLSVPHADRKVSSNSFHIILHFIALRDEME